MLESIAWARRSHLVVIAMAVALAQACSSSGSQQVPQLATVARSPAGIAARLDAGARSPTGMNRSGSPQTIYVADILRNNIDVFQAADGSFAGSISDGISEPWGLFVDGSDNLWVANLDYVTVYPKGQTKPSRTLQDPGERSEDVCVAKDGTVYVSNFTDDAYGPGSVSVYAPGANAPTMILRDANVQYVVGVARDPSGNVFAAVNDSTGVGYIDDFVGGQQSGLRRLPPRFSYASDIKLDAVGNLLVLDGTQLTVAEYTKHGHPTGVSVFTHSQWYAFDLSRDGAYLAGTESRPDNDRGILDAFPSGKRLLNLNHGFSGGTGGVAIAPGRFY